MAKTHAPLSASVYLCFSPQIFSHLKPNFINVPEFIARANDVDPASFATPLPLFLGAVIAGGAALVPDIDTEDSHIYHRLGGFKKPAHKLATWIGGKHRWGTHSLVWGLPLGIILAILTSLSLIATAIVCGFLAYLFLTATFYRYYKMPWLKSTFIISCLALPILMIFKIIPLMPLGWFVYTFGFGIFMHILEDLVTEEKTRIFYPFSSEPFSIGLFHTNSTGEAVVRYLSYFLPFFVSTYYFVTALR